MTMYINAYSTVRDEVPADFINQRSSADPEMDGHLRGFTDYVWDRGGRQMTGGMWGLIRHIGDTRRQYVFQRADVSGLEQWAAQTNSVFFMPDGRVLGASGVDLIASAESAVPFHPAALERARRVRGGLAQPIPEHYPPVRSEYEAVVRNPAEVADRFLSVIAASELAGYFLAGQEVPLAGLRQVLPGAFGTLSPKEQRFVGLLDSGAARAPGPAADEARGLAQQLQWTVESAMMLAHALTLQQLPPGEVTTNSRPLVEWVAQSGEGAVREYCGALAPLPELCDKYEFVRSLRWVAVNESLHPERPATIDPRTAATLVEWHRALAWLFAPGTGWDEVDLST